MAKILVVDNDPTNVKVPLTVLELTGHELLSAEGGAANSFRHTFHCDEDKLELATAGHCWPLLAAHFNRRN